MPGISHCRMHYSVHCMQSHITATHSKGFPAKVGNQSVDLFYMSHTHPLGGVDVSFEF